MKAIVDKILSITTDVNQLDLLQYTALHYAAQKGHLAIVNKLLAAGANPNIYGAGLSGFHTPLGLAILERHQAVIDRLMPSSYEDLAAQGTAILYSAAEAGNLVLLEEALNSPDINYKNNAGETPLHYAVKGNNLAAIDQLLTTPKFDVNQKNAYGKSALNWAINKKTDIAVIERLLNEPAIYFDIWDALAILILMRNFKGINILIQRKLPFNLLLTIPVLIGIGLLTIGIGALIGWAAAMSTLSFGLPIIAVAAVVTTIGGLLLLATIAYSFREKLKAFWLKIKPSRLETNSENEQQYIAGASGNSLNKLSNLSLKTSAQNASFTLGNTFNYTRNFVNNWWYSIATTSSSEPIQSQTANNTNERTR